MLPKISMCVFIRDNNEGAFGLWESMATLMPLADEFYVLDLGSTDGTYEILQDLASKNKKIRLEQSEFPINPENNCVDAGSFAIIPNEMIPKCKNELVWYFQADEIWHEDLVKTTAKRLEDLTDFRGFSFWRYQLTNNFQTIKWFPHLAHRIDYKKGFNFIGDGLSTNRTYDAEIVSTFNGATEWGRVYENKAHELPTHEMVMDISSTGGFIDNIADKRKKHAPMWRENNYEISINGQMKNLEQWHRTERRKAIWTKSDTPFNIPEIMRPLVGHTKYPVRQEILDKIANG
jgi:hypothetical protein